MYLILFLLWTAMVVDLQQPVKSVPITPKVVSYNPAHDEVYSMQHNLCDKVCQGLGTGRWFSPPLHQLNWPPWYNWNIVESGINHHNPCFCSITNQFYKKFHSLHRPLVDQELWFLLIRLAFHLTWPRFKSSYEISCMITRFDI